MGVPMYGAPYPMNPDANLVRQLLSIGRILALVIAIIGIVAIVASVLSIAAWAATFGVVPGSFYVGPAYYGIMTLVNFLAWLQLKPIEQQFAAAQYPQARDHLMIWMILTLVFGVIVGVMLIIAYVKLDQIGRSGMPQPMPGAAASAYPQPVYSAPMTGPPGGVPPMAAAPPPMPASTAAPAIPTCPKCGRPATWVAQYSRWYCYTDAQYL